MRKEYTCHFWIFWMPFIVDRITHFGTSFLRLLLGQLHHPFSVQRFEVLGIFFKESFIEGFEPILNFFNRKLLHWLLGVFWHSIDFGLQSEKIKMRKNKKNKHAYLSWDPIFLNHGRLQGKLNEKKKIGKFKRISILLYFNTSLLIVVEESNRNKVKPRFLSKRKMREKFEENSKTKHKKKTWRKPE